MKSSTSFEQQIHRIYELLEDSGAEVTWDDHIPDPDNPVQPRQIDVSIKRNGNLTLVECRQHKSPQDVQWIEGLIGRRVSLGAQSVIAVSSSGFTSGAMAKAKAHGIVLRDLQKLTDTEIANWGQQVVITLYFYEYSDLDVELQFGNGNLSRIDTEIIKAELKSHPCMQSLFNAAAEQFRSSNVLPFKSQGKSVEFGFRLAFDGFRVCGELVQDVVFRGKAKLVEKKLDAPVVHSYQEPGKHPAQVDATVENFRSLGCTSITHSEDRIFTFLDLSQLDIPPYWQFRYCQIEGQQEMDHRAFEISGVDKIGIVTKGLRIKLCWPA
jgi:hypothetical protein